MKNLLIALLALLALLGSDAALAAASDVRCLKSTGTRTPILLQFEFPQEHEPVGYVTYHRGSGRIPVRLVATHSAEMAPDRPLEFTTTWKETGQAGRPGTYTVVTQGARIYGFTFVRGRDGKQFAFEEDLDATGNHRCEWQDR